MIKQVKYKNLLIVEDQEELRRSIAAYFSEHNNVTECSTLADAIRAVRETAYDAILLDVILPDGSGLKLLEHTEETPVIILSNLGADSNLLDGFSAGATDYIVKPASNEVIEARVALRLLPDSEAQLVSHGLTLNTAKRTAEYKKQPLELTSSEFNILTFLMQHAGELFTANEIYERVWKMPYLNSATIKMHLSNLRKKMLSVSKECAGLIISEFGRGYAFVGKGNE